MMRMSPWEASATVINLLLATGPFAYPQGFIELGPITSTILMIITCFIAYITALFMVEAISVAHAVGDPYSEIANSIDDNSFTQSNNHHRSSVLTYNPFHKDIATKHSVFYIREKIEIGVIA